MRENFIDAIPDIEIKQLITSPRTLPETVNAVYADGKKQAVPVVWDQKLLNAANALGDYVINGLVGDSEVKCFLSVEDKNYIVNGGFEESDMQKWNVSGSVSSGGHIERRTSDPRSGDASFHFWDSEPLNFTVTQEITELPPGRYMLSAFLHGDKGGSAAECFIFAQAGSVYERADLKLAGYKNFQQAVLYINVGAAGSITVGFTVKCAAEGWGGWDDFKLFKVS